jgi:mercuric ion binding protein
MKTLVTLFALTLASFSASAGTRTVTLAVPSMDCPVCPITVKKALTQVPGVSQARVNFDKRRAVVVFDDTQTDVAALTTATANAGYPATLLNAGP